MKKILILSLLLPFLTSCGEDKEPGPSGGYPTDDLQFNKKTNTLLMMGYDFSNIATVNLNAIRIMAEYEFGNSLNHMSMVSGAMFGNAIADSMLLNFQSPGAPFFIMNDEVLGFPPSVEEIEAKQLEVPVLSVAHAVSSNDTAWIIDCKVKLNKDTLTTALFIETYMLAKIQAKVYETGTGMSIDLRMPSQVNFINNPALPEVSLWDFTVSSMDTSKVLVNKGDEYFHDYILLQKFNNERLWGTQLSSYWPFSGEFYKDDVIGTKDTPIRHYFHKPEFDDDDIEYNFEFEEKFLTVVWILDPVTGSMKYVNSFTTK